MSQKERVRKIALDRLGGQVEWMENRAHGSISLENYIISYSKVQVPIAQITAIYNADLGVLVNLVEQLKRVEATIYDS